MIIFIDDAVDGKVSYTKEELVKLLEAARQEGILEGRRQILELQSMTYPQIDTYKKQEFEAEPYYTPKTICQTNKENKVL